MDSSNSRSARGGEDRRVPSAFPSSYQDATALMPPYQTFINSPSIVSVIEAPPDYYQTSVNVSSADPPVYPAYRHPDPVHQEYTSQHQPAVNTHLAPGSANWRTSASGVFAREQEFYGQSMAANVPSHHPPPRGYESSDAPRPYSPPGATSSLNTGLSDMNLPQSVASFRTAYPPQGAPTYSSVYSYGQPTSHVTPLDYRQPNYPELYSSKSPYPYPLTPPSRDPVYPSPSVAPTYSYPGTATNRPQTEVFVAAPAGSYNIPPVPVRGHEQGQGQPLPPRPNPPPPVQLDEATLLKGEYGYLGASLFVFHVPSCWSDADLHKYFSPFGSIVKCGLYINKKTRRHKGFGFVSYTHPRSAFYALKHMDGFHVEGTNKKLSVECRRNELPFLKHALGLGFDDPLPL